MTTQVAIIGVGMVGQSWSICFARSQCAVRLFDVTDGAAEAAQKQIAKTLPALSRLGLLGGHSPAEVNALITVSKTLEEALDGADYVQENAPERIEVKRTLTAQIDKFLKADVPIGSSTSALLPSAIAGDLAGAGRCLVVHPLNPPHLIPAVELVPSPATTADALERTTALMEAIGQVPVIAKRETNGFIMNRLQGAVLDEAVKLVAEGVAEPASVDRAMSAGLSRRWSFMGPFETIDLNAPGGIADFFDRYGSAYAVIGKDRFDRHSWDGQLAEHLITTRRESLPIAELASRQEWRDQMLAELAAFLLGTEK